MKLFKSIKSMCIYAKDHMDIFKTNTEVDRLLFSTRVVHVEVVNGCASSRTVRPYVAPTETLTIPRLTVALTSSRVAVTTCLPSLPRQALYSLRLPQRTYHVVQLV